LSLGTIATTNIHYTPYTNCGTSVVVDTATGNLKFYTDGKFVIDNSHLPMPNGVGLLGGNATHSSGLVVPKPGDCEKYYVFTITTATETGTAGNLYYSIVDMLLPGNGTVASPKGNVISSAKNILVASNVSEALNVVKNNFTGEYWLISASNSLNQLLVYKISSTGIFFHSNYTLSYTLSDIQATSFNPIANKLFVGSFIENEPCLLLDFNVATGFFTSSVSIPGTPLGSSSNPYAGIIDAEWSSDGTKLYISKYRGQAPSFGSGRIYQYDLNFPASPPVVVFSPNTASQSDVCKGLRLGPDNKIYFSYNSPANPNTFIGCINNPNNPGGLSNVNQFQINFTIPITGVGLFPRFPYIESSVINISVVGNNSICAGQNVTLTASGASNYVWSGGVSSTNSSVTVSPSATTSYYVSGSNSCGTDVDTVVVNVIPFYEITATASTSICQGQSTTLTASGSPSYTWTGGVSSSSSSVTVNPNSTTTYYVTGELTTCGNDTDTIVVTVQNLPSVSISGNQSICAGQNVTLTASGASNYVWSGGVSSTNSSVTVSPSATTSYYVSGSNSCGTDVDTVVVEVNISSSALFSYTIDECTNRVVFESASLNAFSFLWNFGDNTVSAIENPEHTYFQNGVYPVTLVVNQGSGCSSSFSQFISITNSNSFDFQIPNVFTPNGDGINDEFKLGGLNSCKKYRLSIYNRWGQKVFEADDAASQFWNGSNGNKKEAVAGVYYYILTDITNTSDSKSLSGYITVIP